MRRAKLIFVDGVDGAGKTYKLNQLMETNDPTLKRFRSSYQINSQFAGSPVDLEESSAHDWRILHDFITQTSNNDVTYLIDRGFLSSYVYSKVLRKTNLSQYLNAYLELFTKISEFWIFTREDVQNMELWEIEVNKEFEKIYSQLSSYPEVVVKRFNKTADGKFITKDFLNTQQEILSGRFDSTYYLDFLTKFILGLNPVDFSRGIVCLDCDGTLMNPGYPKVLDNGFRDEVFNHINEKYKDHRILIITGRQSMPLDLHNKIVDRLGKRATIVLNNRNLGLSSRVLKSAIIHVLSCNRLAFTFIDDREDVMLALVNQSNRMKEFSDLYIAECPVGFLR